LMIGLRLLKLAKKSSAWSLSGRHEQSVYLSLRGAQGDEAIPEIATPDKAGLAMTRRSR
jgi:hypothetical protein